MKKIFSTILCVSVVTIAGSVYAFEMPSAIKGAASAVTSKTNSATQIGVLNTKLNAVNETMQRAFESLTSALFSAEKSAEIKSRIDAIKSDKSLSETEKNSEITKIISDCAATMKEEQETLASQLRNSDEQKRYNVSGAINSLFIASYQYTDIAVDCRGIIMGISANPVQAATLAFELGNLKAMFNLLKNNIVVLKNVTTQAVAIAKAGGVSLDIPKNTSSKASQIDLSDIN